MFITAAIIIQALFWVLLGFLLSLFFIKKEDPVERWVGLEALRQDYSELARQREVSFVESRTLPPVERGFVFVKTRNLPREKADQKILDVATEFYNDVNH